MQISLLHSWKWHLHCAGSLTAALAAVTAVTALTASIYTVPGVSPQLWQFSALTDRLMNRRGLL